MSFRESVSHHNLPFDESGFDFLKYTPHLPVQSNSWFRLHFWMGETEGKTATKRLKSVQETLTPYS
jgi:hypothetical protein